MQHCKLHEVEFEGANFNQTVFKDCDFLNANFYQTKLENADFRTSFNYSLDLDQNMIKNAKFSLDSVAGLLSKYPIQIS